MKKFFLGIFLLAVSFGYAQNILNSKTPGEIRKQESIRQMITEAGDTVSTRNEPLAYGHINDKEIIWSKVVWEVIDFNEKLNQPYYSVPDKLFSGSLSLFDALIEGIRSGEITEFYNDEYFQHRLTEEQIKSRFSRTDTQAYYFEMIEAGEEPDENLIYNFQLDSHDVKMLKIKGMWYIDRRLGEMKYRPLGICVMGPDAQTIGREFDDETYVDLFWIWYPDARTTLNNYTVFSPKNASSKITFDDMINARRFSSVMYKSMTDRGVENIDEYIPRDAKSQLNESLRIRNSILQTESDMWNY